MRIEVLFPERCNLYGDLSNVEYLKRCLPQAEFVETSLQEEPRFAKEPVDLVYLGPMTERTQELVLERLRPTGSGWRSSSSRARPFSLPAMPGAAGGEHPEGGRGVHPLPGPVPLYRPAGYDAPA